MRRLAFFLCSFCAIALAQTKAAGTNIRTIGEADDYRISVLQALHVAQNPVYTKQEKASKVEVAAYVAAVEKAVVFKKWLIRGTRCAVELRKLGNSNDGTNRRTFSKAAWSIHDAEIKTTGPFTRNDIGVAMKVMNDAREIFQLPVALGSSVIPAKDE
jgi:hypothetical protein